MWTKEIVTIEDLETINVRYKKKKWAVRDLLEHLAEEVKRLEESQCKPNGGCLYLMRESLYDRCYSVMEDMAGQLAVERYLHNDRYLTEEGEEVDGDK